MYSFEQSRPCGCLGVGAHVSAALLACDHGWLAVECLLHISW